jgi:hypothetical protein
MKTRPKKRQRQLDAIRARRRARLGNPTDDPQVRLRIATAVHKAVCRFTESDGSNCCAYYAVAGCGLLVGLFKLNAVVQAGSFQLQLDLNADGTCLTFLGENWRAGEVHSWIAIPQKDGGADLIDFASRHYSHYVENLPKIDGGTYTWRHGEPPAYVWGRGPRPHPWTVFCADEEPTMHMWKVMASDPGAVVLVRMAVDEYLQRDAQWEVMADRPGGMVLVRTGLTSTP